MPPQLPAPRSLEHLTQATETMEHLNTALVCLDQAQRSNDTRNIECKPLRQATREYITAARIAAAKAIEATAKATHINA